MEFPLTSFKAIGAPPIPNQILLARPCKAARSFLVRGPSQMDGSLREGTVVGIEACCGYNPAVSNVWDVLLVEKRAENPRVGGSMLPLGH